MSGYWCVWTATYDQLSQPTHHIHRQKWLGTPNKLNKCFVRFCNTTQHNNLQQKNWWSQEISTSQLLLLKKVKTSFCTHRNKTQPLNLVHTQRQTQTQGLYNWASERSTTTNMFLNRAHLLLLQGLMVITFTCI